MVTMPHGDDATAITNRCLYLLYADRYLLVPTVCVTYGVPTRDRPWRCPALMAGRRDGDNMVPLPAGVPGICNAAWCPIPSPINGMNGGDNGCACHMPPAAGRRR